MSSSRVKSAERVMAVLDLLGRTVDADADARHLRPARPAEKYDHHLLNVMLRSHYVAPYWPDRRVCPSGAAFEIGAPTSARASTA